MKLAASPKPLFDPNATKSTFAARYTASDQTTGGVEFPSLNNGAPGECDRADVSITSATSFSK